MHYWKRMRRIATAAVILIWIVIVAVNGLVVDAPRPPAVVCTINCL